VATTKAWSLLSVGRMDLASGEPAQAKHAFKGVQRALPNSELAERAKGFIFEIEHLQPGMPAPPFTGATLDGAEFSSASLRGTPYLLVFWASWCARCVTEVPDLRAAVESMKQRGRPFEIVAVALDDHADHFADTARDIGMPGVLIKPESGFEHPAARLYNVQSLPTWYLVDAGGVIRARDPIEDKLMPALESLPASP
jgi:peroxiredoxin